jgi:chromate transporter
LLDAVSVGQVTPGPLLTTATFIGYVRGHDIFGTTVGGIAGGILATVAIFLPAFAFVALLGAILPMIRNNRLVRGGLDGMNAAIVALILVVAVQLARSALWPVTVVNLPIAIVTLVAMLVWNVNATWTILAGALAGLIAHATRGA